VNYELNRRASNKRWTRLLVLTGCALFVLSGPGGQNANGQAPVGAFTEQSDVGITPKAGSGSFDDARHEYSVTGGERTCGGPRMPSTSSGAECLAT
jgi:hypothetical protein